MGKTKTKTKTKSQRIGTFADFYKSKPGHKQPIKENNEVAINVPFYQDAIDYIVDELQVIAGNPIDWMTLIDYIKTKYLVIDRDIQGGDDNLVIAHVRDLLFHRFGDSFLGGDAGCLTGCTAEMGAKALVMSQLASEILHRVRVNAGLNPPLEPETAPKPLSTVSLDTGNYYDDLPFEMHHVAGFQNFTEVLKESINKINLQDDGKALDYCLNKIESAAGSTRLDDILKVAKKEGFQDIKGYLLSIVDGYLKTTPIELNGNTLKKRGDEKPLLKVAKKLFAHEITRKIMEAIKKETK